MAASKEGRESSPKLFIHVPKTAGTSFRTTAESKFGSSRVLRDYGPKSSATSNAIRREVYESGDSTGIVQAIEKQKAVLVAGHFPISKYGGILGLTNAIAFFRDPVNQVISHFRHAIRDHGFNGDIITFARQGGVRNLQSRMLDNIDPALLGIVGLTEEYQESVTIMNCRWGFNFGNRKRNVSSRKDLQNFESSKEQIEEIKKLNQVDRLTYKRAYLVFNNSLKCVKHGHDMDPRGAISLANTKHGIRGWAFDMHSDTLLNVDVYINGEHFSRAKCGNFVQGVACWKLPRNGYVGFTLDTGTFRPGDEVTICDTQLGLMLAKSVVK